MVKVVGIGDGIISHRVNEVLKTFALGSCVALTLYCPRRRLAGMIHIGLPSSGIFGSGSGSPGSKRAYYYADLAVPLILSQLDFKYGCGKKELEIEVFGGADSLRDNDLFKIGLKNRQMVERILTGLDLKFAARETGGNCSRTVEIAVANGQTRVFTQAMLI
jgi:chemotaxis protein CheD